MKETPELTPYEAIQVFTNLKGRSAPWSPEECIKFARKLGVEYWDDRAWGPVFLQAMRNGLIERGGLFPRKTSNGSVRPGWIKTCECA